MTSIRGSLGLVVAGAVGDLPSQAAELIQIAERNAHRLIGLVNDILDMEKIESGQMDYKLTERSVGEVVAQAVSDNQGYADEHQVTFRFFDEAEGATAIMDGERIT
ncbi:MAG: histidine kinase dimerization/phospho-acceptor domain-containing protein, partial [Rickettsiales bacterium]